MPSATDVRVTALDQGAKEQREHRHPDNCKCSHLLPHAAALLHMVRTCSFAVASDFAACSGP